MVMNKIHNFCISPIAMMRQYVIGDESTGGCYLLAWPLTSGNLAYRQLKVTLFIKSFSRIRNQMENMLLKELSFVLLAVAVLTVCYGRPSDKPMEGCGV